MKEKSRSILFTTLILGLALANILTPIKSFSNKEGRYLQELPKFSYNSLIKGKFTEEFETFTTDQFIARNNWISLKTIGDLSMLKKDNGRVYFGKEGYLFDVDEEINKKQLEENLSNVNILLNNINQYNKDITTTILLVPTKNSVLKDKLPSYAPVTNEREIVKNIKDYLEINSNILDLTDLLRNNSQEYIYYKTDHHWTTKGAFYAYKYYLNDMGATLLEDEGFNIDKVSDEFLGTSYRKANILLGKADSIYKYTPKHNIAYNMIVNKGIKGANLYDETYLNKSDKYSYFLGGDKALIEIDTSTKNGKSILVIKDSFANSFIPFLINHYERISIIDPRYFSMSIIDYISENPIDELLFLFNIQNFVQEKTFYLFGR